MVYSCVDSAFIAPGSSHRKSQAHQAWQDVAATERDPILRAVSMHGKIGDRRQGAGAVAGLRARASRAMILSGVPLKDVESKHEHNERMAQSSTRGLNIPPGFMDSLYGRSLRIHPASPSVASRCQHRPLSGVTHTNVPQQPTHPQRPHTAPATERKFRRPSGSMRQRPNLGKASVSITADEQLGKVSPARLSAAPGHSKGFSLRPATPLTFSSGTALGPTWQRRMRGVTAPGDLSERRAGRSRSTEPLLLRHQPGMAASWSGEASITDTISKSPGRPRMKAPVDRWWDERQGSKASPARSSNVFSSLGASQGPRLRSCSAGRRRHRTSSSLTASETPVRSPQPGSKQELRPVIQCGSPQSRERTGIRNRDASSGRRKRTGSTITARESEPCLQGPLSSRSSHRHEVGMRMSEVQQSHKADCIYSGEDQLTEFSTLRGARAAGFPRQTRPTASMCDSGISTYDESYRVESDVSSVESPEMVKASEKIKQEDFAVAVQKLRNSGRQKDSCWTDRTWVGNAHEQAADSLKTSQVKECENAMIQIGGHDVPLSCLSTVSDCWDSLCCGGAGMLGTLHSSAQSLALDCGITDGWCCSLFEELLDEDWKDSGDEF